MHTSKQTIPVVDAEPHAIAPHVARLTDLVTALRERRRSPENLRAAIARRVSFLRAAGARMSDQFQSVIGRRERVREDVQAMAQVLRVRAALTADEQRSFDQLVVDYTQSTLGLLVERDDEEALTSVRRYLASVSTTMPPST
jgi:hypothetical protein